MSRLEIQVISREKIVIDPRLSRLMPVNPRLMAEIAQSMRETGFLPTKPITLWRDPGTNRLIMLDGQTRFAAAEAAGIRELPAVEIELRDYEAAYHYAYACQRLNRQTTDHVILYRLIMSVLNRWGGDRRSNERNNESHAERNNDEIAKNLGVTVYEVKRVRAQYYQQMSEANRQQVREGTLSVYNLIPEKTEPADTPTSPARVQKPAVSTPRRKTDEALLQRLGLTDEQIILVQLRLEAEKRTLKRYLNQLVLKDISNNPGQDGVGEPDAESGQELAADIATSLRSTNVSKTGAGISGKNPGPNSFANGGSASGNTTDSDKTWKSWSHEQDELLLHVYYAAKGQSLAEAARNYLECEKKVLGENSHTFKGVEHQLQRLRGVKARRLSAEEAESNLAKARDNLEKKLRGKL